MKRRGEGGGQVDLMMEAEMVVGGSLGSSLIGVQ